jgi:hypothetical protein
MEEGRIAIHHKRVPRLIVTRVRASKECKKLLWSKRRLRSSETDGFDPLSRFFRKCDEAKPEASGSGTTVFQLTA